MGLARSIRVSLYAGARFLASKVYYFGVGGGLEDFCQLVQNDSSPLKHEIIHTFDDGKSNIRQIVQLGSATRTDTSE